MLLSNMKAKQSGFTAIELLFTILLVAVILGFGLPNFRPFIQNSRMTAFANDLVADINLARSEALKRRLPVTICASTNSSASAPTCADGGSFAQWIVFVDANGDGTAGDLVDTDGNGTADSAVYLRRGTGANTITPTPNSGGDRLTYAASGFAAPDADRLNFVRLCDSRGNKVSAGGLSAARVVAIGPTGRPSVRRDPAGITSAAGNCPT